MAHLSLVSLIVPDYDEAIAFFVDALDFELIEDVPSTTNDGRPKRWVTSAALKLSGSTRGRDRPR